MKPRGVLRIDTTSETGTVCLNGKYLSWPARGRVELLLAKIDELLKVQSSKLNQIKAIEANPGPGSFMGSRVGVTVANALASTLGVPVNGKKPPIAVKYSPYGSTSGTVEPRAAR